MVAEKERTLVSLWLNIGSTCLPVSQRGIERTNASSLFNWCSQVKEESGKKTVAAVVDKG